MEVTVNAKALQKSVHLMNAIEHNLVHTSLSIAQVPTSFPAKSEAYSMLANKVDNISKQVSALTVKTSRLYNAGITIAKQYEKTEATAVIRGRIAAGIGIARIAESNDNWGNILGGGVGIASLPWTQYKKNHIMEFSTATNLFKVGAAAGAIASNVKKISSVSISGSVKQIDLVNFGNEKLGLNLLNYNAEYSEKASFDFFDGEVAAGASVAIGGSLAQLKYDHTAGLASTEAEINVGKVAAKGKVGFTLYKDGKLDPSVSAKLEASVAGVEGKISTKFGSDDVNIHGSAKGTIGYASAKAEVKVDKNGVTANAGLEAYAAKGQVKGGITLFGIKIDATLEGKAGGLGATASYSAGKNSVSGSIGAGLGLGAGLKVDIDWSNFSLIRR